MAGYLGWSVVMVIALRITPGGRGGTVDTITRVSFPVPVPAMAASMKSEEELTPVTRALTPLAMVTVTVRWTLSRSLMSMKSTRWGWQSTSAVTVPVIFSTSFGWRGSFEEMSTCFSCLPRRPRGLNRTVSGVDSPGARLLPPIWVEVQPQLVSTCEMASGASPLFRMEKVYSTTMVSSTWP